MSLFDKIKQSVSGVGGGDKEKKPEIPANANSGKLIKQGELKKLGGSRGGWKLWQARWFVLRDTGLSYYESEKDYKKNKTPKGHDLVLDIKPVDGVNKENEFYFISAERRILASAKNQQIMNEWLNVLGVMRGGKTTVHELTVDELFDSKSSSGATESSTEGFLDVQAASLPWEQASASASASAAAAANKSDAKSNDGDIKYDAVTEDEKAVNGPIKGTEAQLLALLTNPTSDIGYRNAFLMQHTSFTSSDVVMAHLEAVYDRKPADYSQIIPSTPRGGGGGGKSLSSNGSGGSGGGGANDDPSSTSQTSVSGDSKQCLTHKLHVLGILVYWAESYFDDLVVLPSSTTATPATSPVAAASVSAANFSAAAVAASGGGGAGAASPTANTPPVAGSAGLRFRRFMERSRDLKNDANEIHALFPRAAVSHLIGEHAKLEAAFAKSESEHTSVMSAQDQRRASRVKARESGSGGSGSGGGGGGSLALTAEQRANLGADDASVGEFHATNIAAQLTLLDFDLFKLIRGRELVRKEWTRKDTCHFVSPNLLHMVDTFNERSFWVASEILLRSDDKARIHMMKKMINAAFECLQLHNFYSAFAIMNGLSLGPVHRLQRCWASIPNNSRERYSALKDMAVSSKNYPNYRKLYSGGMGKAQIPHLAVVLKDLFQLEEVPTIDKEKNNAINWHKYWKEYKIVADLQFCQSLTYHHLKYQPTLVIALQAGHSRVLTEPEMFKRSYQYEPKQGAGYTGGGGGGGGGGGAASAPSASASAVAAAPPDSAAAAKK